MRHLFPCALRILLALAVLASGAPDTLSIVGVMVEFQEDVLGDNTTGKGTFDSDEADYSLDNRSHDRDYFEKQMKFARNYFLFASDSALFVRYAVFDARMGLNHHITLDSKMKHYRVPQKRDRESYDEFNLRLNQGIMALAGDALRKAGDAGALNLGARLPTPDGDSLTVDGSTLFLIFHAGASQLTDGGLLGSLGANTPSDLVDSYIAPEDFRDYDGMSYDDDETVTVLRFDRSGTRAGIFSNDSSNFVDKLMICSETMSQDELNWGIHGIIVNQITRALGVPDLWDTDDGVTAVGGFCLMDVAGYNTFRGFIPVLPSAWCRVKLGWVNPVVAEPDSTFRSVTTLYSTHAGSGGNEIIKVPLSATEYYLIENRQFLPFRDSLLQVRTDNAVDSVFSYNVYDSINGPFVEMFLDSLCPDSACRTLLANRRKAKGRVLNANSYDVGLPGFGVLVWHVDEQVIRDKIGINMVNANMDRRGVDLEEADGIEDIGVALSNLIETIYLYGGPEDFFPHRDYHAGGRFVNAITPYEQSNRYFGTQTNTGGYTGVTVAVDTFAGSAREHRYLNTAAYQLGHDWHVGDFAADSFRVTVSWALSQGKWPRSVPGAAAMTHPADIGGNLYAVTDSGLVSAFRSDGTPLFTDSALFLSGWRFPSSPSVLDSFLVFSGVRAGTDTIAVHRYHPVSKQDSILLCLKGDTLSTLISVVRDTLLFGTVKGKVHKTAAGFDTAVTLSAGVPVQSLACDSLRVWAVCGKEIYKLSGAAMKVTAARTVPGMAGSRMKFSVGNVWPDRPGLEIALCDNAGNAALLDSSLNLLPGWPVKIDNASEKPPSLGDVDGDGLMDVVIPGNNKVYALNYTGTHLSNWPHVAARRESIGQFNATASLYDIDGNGDMEVFVPAPNGNILILDEDGMYYEFTAGAKVLSRALPFGGLPGPSCVVRNIDTDHDANSNVPEHVEIYTMSGEGALACFNIPLKGAYKSGWEAEGGSLQRTYVYSGAATRFMEASGDVSIDTLFSYPNPARVNDVMIKYKLSRGAKSVRLKLFNPAGDVIMDKKGLPAYALWNHYPLSLKKTAPGMYTLKLEADGPSGETFKFTKVGVIK